MQLWEDAIGAYRSAREASSKIAEAWLGEARSLSSLARLDEATTLYRRVLQKEAGELEPEVERTVQRELSHLTAQTGQTSESRALLEASLREGEEDEATLATLIALCDAQEDWAASTVYRAILIDRVASSGEKAKLLLTQGRIFHSRLGDGNQAIQALKQALLLDPKSKVVMATLLEAALRSTEYAEVAETLDKLASNEADGEKRGHHLLAKGLLYRDHLNDELLAIGALNDALDASPLLLEAFEALDGIHVKRLDFDAQAQSYERMLRRVEELPETEDLVFKLLLNLGSLQRKLGQLDASIETLERGKALRPSSVEVHRKLARNLEESSGREAEAIDAFYEVLRLDPLKVDAFKALRGLFTR